MTFLHPWTAFLAAAVAVPLLLVLYVLKLRRRILRTASTLLWRRSFEDLQVNVPFQRLRLSALFLLQLLALLLLILALGEPVVRPDGGAASRVILLVDRSASMNATDAGTADGAPRARLDAAKRSAADVVERLLRGGGSREVMIIAFARRAQVVTGFEARRQVLLDAIASIAPTDEEADLAAALQLAGSFAAGGEADQEEPPDVVLISDGGVAPPEDPAGFSLRAGRFRFVSVGPGSGDEDGAAAAGNVGIVSLSARRDYEDPSRVIAFARLVNTGADPVETLVSLLVDERPGPIERVAIGPASGLDRADALGAAVVSFAIDLPTGAVLSVRHRKRDALGRDDTAAVVLPAPARPRVALVSGADEPDPYLRELLEGFETRSVRLMSLGAFEQEDPVEVDLGRLFDLVVFDEATPSRLPAIPTLTFGAAPPDWEVVAAPDAGGRRILSWPRQHAVMRHVSLDTVVFAGFGAFRLPPDATPLAVGPDGPVIAMFTARGAPHVAVGFALRNSTWPTHVSVAVFVQNALDYLTLSRSGRTSIAVRPGEPVAVRVAGDADRLVITGPASDAGGEIAAAPGTLVTLPMLRRVGLYTVAGAQPPQDRVAVSMLSELESDVRPARTLVVNAELVTAGAAAEAAPRGVWAWFAAAALAVLVMEWLLYCRLLRG